MDASSPGIGFPRSLTRLVPSRFLWLLAASLIFALLSLFAARRSTRSGRHFTDVSGYYDHDSYKDILNSTLGFQKIFVINLPSRADHRDAMTLTAHLTGLDVEFVDGVTEVDPNGLPQHNPELPQPALGAWRAHMNIARRIVEENIATALILEDDVDWDIRLKENMQRFARASRLLIQPQIGTTNEYVDLTNPRRSPDEQPYDIPLSSSPRVPTTCPYGDTANWDIFWLGHCGTRFPEPDNPTMPLGRVPYFDETVPESQHIGIQVGNDKLVTEYPNHTRVAHRASITICSLAYAVSLPGARRMLYEFGVKEVTNEMDLMMNAMCEGIDGRDMRKCLSVQPEIFQHHRVAGNKSGQSNIKSHEGYNPVAYTRNIRWSTRLNLPKLVDGETDYTDQYPDGAEPADFGF